MTRALALWCAIGFFSTANAAAAGGTNAGAQLAAGCAACHRLDNHAGALPRITGLDSRELASMLRAFKQDAQPNHIMHTVSLTLSDDEIASLAAYLADLGKTKPP